MAPEPPCLTRSPPGAISAQATADRIRGGDTLLAYLGISTTHVGPATMAATLDVRPEILNPFGSLRRGVLWAPWTLSLRPCSIRNQHGCWAATTEFNLNLFAAVSEGPR